MNKIKLVVGDYSGDGQRGLTDSGVRLKYQFNPNAALIVGSSLPTGSTNFRNGYQPEVVLALRKSVGNKINILGNVGYTYNKSVVVDCVEAERYGSITGSLALTRDMKNGLAFIEVYGQTNKFNNDSTVAVGLAHRVSNNFSIDGRVGRNLSNTGTPDYFVGVGLTLTR